MKNRSKLILFVTQPSFDLKALENMLYKAGHCPYTRTCVYSFAKQLRSQYPDYFIRVLKVLDSYFIITDEDEYKDFWEFRKIAMRNERRMKK